MKQRLRRAACLCLRAADLASARAADWTTPAEAAHFRTTPDYAVAKLAAAALAAARGAR